MSEDVRKCQKVQDIVRTCYTMTEDLSQCQNWAGSETGFTRTWCSEEGGRRDFHKNRESNAFGFQKTSIGASS